MNSQCSHHHHHDHNHKHESSSLWNHHGHSHGDLHGRELLWAVIINVLLTVVQLVGGVLSGSLALVADAVHNFSDAGSLALAAFVRKVSGRPPSDKMTFGFGRAEILGALVNSTTLVAVGLYLLYESIERFYNPQKVEGEIVVGIAAFALIVDLITVGLTYKGAKESVNIRAAFIHNLSDAFASVVVMISGALILWLQLSWIDLLASLLISVFILYHSYLLLKECLSILM
ncbi:MAG: cation transporter, partial [Bdellovibrionales bacterium]|nr:cation transporter [Bdellovibrionales bacterium]